MRAIQLGCVASLVLVGTVLAAGQPLAYRFPAGDTFEVVSKIHGEAPVVGAFDTTMTLKTVVLSVDAQGFRVDEDVLSRTAGQPDTHVKMQAHVSPEGVVTDITGVDWNDPNQALVAKNASSGLPRLPNAPVSIGSSWQDERPLYLPKTRARGIPQVIRVRFTYTVTALQAGAKPTVAMSVVAKESPGQSATFAATGSCVADSATGKPLTSHMEGLATFKVAFTTVKVPFKMDLTGH